MIYSRVVRSAIQSRPSRRLLGSSSSSRWARDGTLELAVGGTLLTFLLVDRFLVYQQDQGREQIMNQLRSETRSPQELQDMEDWYNMPSLFDCIVRKIPLNLDGYKCLTGIREGDVVQVLEEKVGPGSMYNLCRKLDDKGRATSVGWFPTMYLEKR